MVVVVAIGGVLAVLYFCKCFRFLRKEQTIIATVDGSFADGITVADVTKKPGSDLKQHYQNRANHLKREQEKATQLGKLMRIDSQESQKGLLSNSRRNASGDTTSSASSGCESGRSSEISDETDKTLASYNREVSLDGGRRRNQTQPRVTNGGYVRNVSNQTPTRDYTQLGPAGCLQPVMDPDAVPLGYVRAYGDDAVPATNKQVPAGYVTHVGMQQQVSRDTGYVSFDDVRRDQSPPTTHNTSKGYITLQDAQSRRRPINDEFLSSAMTTTVPEEPISPAERGAYSKVGVQPLPGNQCYVPPAFLNRSSADASSLSDPSRHFGSRSPVGQGVYKISPSEAKTPLMDPAVTGSYVRMEAPLDHGTPSTASSDDEDKSVLLMSPKTLQVDATRDPYNPSTRTVAASQLSGKSTMV